MKKIIYIAAIVSQFMYAGDIDIFTSMQGFTGIINTPNAEVLDESSIEFAFNNQNDANDIANRDYRAEQYFINVGFLPNLELTGRLSEIDKTHRDLSANIKFQLPLYYKYLPKIAVGIQDLGGLANYYDAKYVVLSKDIWKIRASVGYGTDRLDGVFGGLEIKVFDWIYLLGDYDTKEKNVGVRINVPKSLFKIGYLSFVAKSNLDYNKGDFDFGVNFKIPLGEKKEKIYKNYIAKNNFENQNKEENIDSFFHKKVSAKSALDKKINISKNNKYNNVLLILRNKLVSFGFENIDIGLYDDGKNIYVAYENNVLPHNEVDAVGVILGYMLQLGIADKYEKFSIAMKRDNIRVKEIRGDLKKYRYFIYNPIYSNILDFKKSLFVTSDFLEDIEPVVENANNSYFKPRLEIYPGLITFIGNEVGIFDYFVSLRAYLHTNIYKGIDVGMLADFPLINSDDFEKGHVYHKYSHGNEIKSVMLHKSDVYKSFINILSVGSYEKDYLGGMDQAQYDIGNNKFKIRLGYFKHKDNDNDERKIYLGSYGYYFNPKDLLIELTAGKYWNQDTGFDLKLKRYFGDIAIIFFYQNTTDQYIGAGIEIPLVPNRIKNPKYVQMQGKKDFNYYIRSTIRRADGTNKVMPAGAKVPKTDFEISSEFTNRDRFTTSYLRNHIYRFLDVYKRYVGNE